MNIGITGHQRLPDPTVWEWVASELEKEIARLSKPIVGVTCLAVGTDQLFAEIILKCGGLLLHIKPFADYERTFDGNELTAYREFAAKAGTEVLSVQGDDEDAYLAAGKRVVDHSDRLFAVWDGKPAHGKGGTADIVKYARYKYVKVLHFNPSDLVIH